MKNREELYDRLRKLLALAGSDNPHEAALALAHAQALATRHEIEIADLGETPKESIEESVFYENTGTRMIHWKLRLAGVLCRANGCDIYYSGPRVHVAGRPSDVKRAAMLFGECSNAIERLARTQARGRGKRFAQSFRLGCVDAIRAAIKAEEATTRDELRGKVSETALVVIDTRKSEAKGWLRERHTFGPGRRRPMAGAGFSEGQNAGAGVYGGASRARIGAGGGFALEG